MKFITNKDNEFGLIREPLLVEKEEKIEIGEKNDFTLEDDEHIVKIDGWYGDFINPMKLITNNDKEFGPIGEPLSQMEL